MSILTLFKPKYTIKTLVNPLNLQTIFIMLNFIFMNISVYIYMVWCINIRINVEYLIIIKFNDINDINFD